MVINQLACLQIQIITFQKFINICEKKFQNQRPPSPHSDTYFDTLKFDDFGTVCIYRFLRLPVALA